MGRAREAGGMLGSPAASARRGGLAPTGCTGVFGELVQGTPSTASGRLRAAGVSPRSDGEELRAAAEPLPQAGAISARALPSDSRVLRSRHSRRFSPALQAPVRLASGSQTPCPPDSSGPFPGTRAPVLHSGAGGRSRDPARSGSSTGSSAARPPAPLPGAAAPGQASVHPAPAEHLRQRLGLHRSASCPSRPSRGLSERLRWLCYFTA